MKEKIDLSLNRSLEELESSYWEFIEATEGEDSSGWSKSVQENISALEDQANITAVMQGGIIKAGTMLTAAS